MSGNKSNAKRKAEQHFEAQLPDAAASRQVRPATPAPQSADVQNLYGPMNVIVSLEGVTVNVADIPLASAENVFSMGTFAQRLAYNQLAGRLNPEIRDTSSATWYDVPNAIKFAFRKCRDKLDSEVKANPTATEYEGAS